MTTGVGMTHCQIGTVKLARVGEDPHVKLAQGVRQSDSGVITVIWGMTEVEPPTLYTSGMGVSTYVGVGDEDLTCGVKIG